MGLDAYIPCRCFQLGLSKSAPVDVEFDEKLGRPCPTPAVWESGIDLGEYFQWETSACLHKDFKIIWQHISRWKEFSEFFSALNDLGESNFPLLFSELSVGVITSPIAARGTLNELKNFRDSIVISPQVNVLVDEDTGGEFYRSVTGHDHVVYVHSDWRFALVEGYFLIYRGEKEVFRARRIKQIVEANLWNPGQPGRVILTDLETGVIFMSPPAIGCFVSGPDGRWGDDQGRVQMHYPTRLRAFSRIQSPQDHENIILALETVLLKSVESGLPVYWV